MVTTHGSVLNRSLAHFVMRGTSNVAANARISDSTAGGPAGLTSRHVICLVLLIGLLARHSSLTLKLRLSCEENKTVYFRKETGYFELGT